MRTTLAMMIMVLGMAIFGAAVAAPQDPFTSPALGRYGLKAATIAAAQGGQIKDSDLFDEKTQDGLAKNLLDQAGLREFQAGRLSGADFQARVARTWSSLEDPTAKGQSHFMKRNVDKHAKVRVAVGSRPPHNRELAGSYSEWRSWLLASGWRPYLMRPSAECRLFYGMCERFPETVDCAPTGRSYCNFAFLDDGGHFIIVGVDADFDFKPSGSVVIAPAAASHLEIIRARLALPESDARLRAGGMRVIRGDYAAARAELIAEGFKPYAFEHSGKRWDDCAKSWLDMCRAHPETLNCSGAPIEDALELCVYAFTDPHGRVAMAYQSSPPYGGVRLYPASDGDLQRLAIRSHPGDASVPLANKAPAAR